MVDTIRWRAISVSHPERPSLGGARATIPSLTPEPDATGDPGVPGDCGRFLRRGAFRVGESRSPRAAERILRDD
jgi:hypothetical protein